MTLLDVTMASAARSGTPELGVVTIEMKTSFMQPAVGALTAKGELMHRTATMAFTQATVYDANGKALCPRHRHLQVHETLCHRRARRERTERDRALALPPTAFMGQVGLWRTLSKREQLSKE